MGDSRALGQRGIVLPAFAIACLMFAACLLHPRAAAAASTCPGKNGQVAVVTDSERNLNAWSIGLIEPEMQVRSLFRAHSFPENFPSSPSFSCDGSGIVYQQEEEEEPCSRLEIVTMGGQRREIPTPHLCSRNPAFLLNGNVIFTGSPPRSGPAATYEIDADGSHLHRLFNFGEFACTANGRFFVSSFGGLKILFLLNAKGKKLHRLAPRLPFKVAQYNNPSLSANGKWVAYEKEIYSHGRGPNLTNLYLVRSNGSDRQQLTTNGNSLEPAFSPDGRWIAFIRAFTPGDSEGNVYALSVSHPSEVKGLTDLPAQDPPTYLDSPAWGPR